MHMVANPTPHATTTPPTHAPAMTFLSLFLPFTMVATTATCITLNYLMSDGSYGNGTMTEISDKYRSDWSPSSWAFYIWPFLYARFVTFALYVCVYRNELSAQPIAVSLAMMYNLSALLQSTWVYLFINEHIWAGLIVISVLAIVTTWLAFASAVYVDIEHEIEDDRSYDSIGNPIFNAGVHATRYILHKIIHVISTEWMFRIYASWVMIATSLNVNILLRERGTASTEDDVMLESIAIGYIWVHPLVFMLFMRFWGWKRVLYTDDRQNTKIPRRFDEIAGVVMTWAAVAIATRDDITDESLKSRLVKWITVGASSGYTIATFVANRLHETKASGGDKGVMWRLFCGCRQGTNTF